MAEGLDPLEGIGSLPLETQVAVIVSVLRSVRASNSRIESKLDWLNRSLWTLIATVVAGVVIYWVNQHQNPVKTNQGNAAGAVLKR